jgi:4-amino-4-deoxychorismate lyase
MHLDWHQRRVDATLNYFYPSEAKESEAFPLHEILSSCSIPDEGVYRCRIVYDLNALSVEFFQYTSRSIESLKLVVAPPGYDYRYKYADRKVLEELYAQRGEADDILITREGWITDTSIANIAFRIAERWYAPSMPLLAGTTWKRLVSSGLLIPRPIHQTEIKLFEAFRIFNAMNDWDTPEKSIRTILIE